MQGDETDNGWNSEITEISNITELLAQRFIENEAPAPRARVRLNTVRTPPPVMEINEPTMMPEADTAPGRQRVSVTSPNPAPITVETFPSEVVAAPQPPPDTASPHVALKRESQLDRYLPLDTQTTIVEIPVPGAPVEYSGHLDEPSWGGRRPTLALAEVAVLGWVATFKAAVRRMLGLRVSHDPEALEDELLPPSIQRRLFRLALPVGLVAGIVVLGAVFTQNLGGTARVAATTGIEAPAPAPVIAKRSPVVEVKVVRRRRGRQRR